MRKGSVRAAIFAGALLASFGGGAVARAKAVKAWSCTLPMASDAMTGEPFSFTLYIGHRFWSTGQTFALDTGDAAAPLNITPAAAKALHIDGSAGNGSAAIGIGGGDTGYYTHVVVNLCGRVFKNQMATVLTPVIITNKEDSLAGGTSWMPNLIGAPFLVNNGLSLVINPVKETVTFEEGEK